KTDYRYEAAHDMGLFHHRNGHSWVRRVKTDLYPSNVQHRREIHPLHDLTKNALSTASLVELADYSNLSLVALLRSCVNNTHLVLYQLAARHYPQKHSANYLELIHLIFHVEKYNNRAYHYPDFVMLPETIGGQTKCDSAQDQR